MEFVKIVRVGRRFAVMDEMMLKLWRAWKLCVALQQEQMMAYPTVFAWAVVEESLKMDMEEIGQRGCIVDHMSETPSWRN